MNANENKKEVGVRPNRLPDGRAVTKTHATRSISGLETPYPCDPECGCRVLPEGVEPRSIYVEVRVGRNRKTRKKELWKVPEHISVEGVEWLCRAVAHDDRKANWAGWQVIAREDQTVVQLKDRMVYCQKLPPRCRCCGDYECSEVAPDVRRRDQSDGCCAKAMCVERIPLTKQTVDTLGLWFDPPMVMAVPPVTDTVGLPPAEPANETESDSAEPTGGAASSLRI